MNVWQAFTAPEPLQKLKLYLKDLSAVWINLEKMKWVRERERERRRMKNMEINMFIFMKWKENMHCLYNTFYKNALVIFNNFKLLYIMDVFKLNYDCERVVKECLDHT